MTIDDLPFLPTNDVFALGQFAGHLAAAQPENHAIEDCRDRLLYALWSKSFDVETRDIAGHETLLTSVGVSAVQHDPTKTTEPARRDNAFTQHVPTSEIAKVFAARSAFPDIVYEYIDKHKKLDGYFEDFLEIQDVVLALMNSTFDAYPDIGKALLERLILPPLKLRRFCASQGLVEPYVLIRRLDGDPLEKLASGKWEAGRPAKWRDLYMRKFIERRHRGANLPSLNEEAKWLRKWLIENAQDHIEEGERPDWPAESTIRDNLKNIMRK